MHILLLTPFPSPFPPPPLHLPHHLPPQSQSPKSILLHTLFFSVMLCPIEFSETIRQIIPDLNCLCQVYYQRNIKVTNTSDDREGGILTAQQYYT